MKMNLANVPWTDVLAETDELIIFRDGYPVNPGHLLVVPKDPESMKQISLCFRTAYIKGKEAMRTDGATGFNVGLNNGASAGQTCNYPHVHMIPRYDGDTQDPTGGVRMCVPERGNYKK